MSRKHLYMHRLHFGPSRRFPCDGRHHFGWLMRLPHELVLIEMLAMRHREVCPNGCLWTFFWSLAMAFTIEDVSIPNSKLAREVTELGRDTESPLLFHHSSRV